MRIFMINLKRNFDHKQRKVTSILTSKQMSQITLTSYKYYKH